MVPLLVCTHSAAGHFDQSSCSALLTQSPTSASRPGTSAKEGPTSEGLVSAGCWSCWPIEARSGWRRLFDRAPADARGVSAPKEAPRPEGTATEGSWEAQASKACRMASRMVNPWLTARVRIRRLSASVNLTNIGFISRLGMCLSSLSHHYMTSSLLKSITCDAFFLPERTFCARTLGGVFVQDDVI